MKVSSIIESSKGSMIVEAVSAGISTVSPWPINWGVTLII